MFNFFGKGSNFGNVDLFQLSVVNPQIAIMSYLNLAQEMIKNPKKLEEAQNDLATKLIGLQKELIKDLKSDDANCINLNYNKENNKFDDSAFANNPIINASRKFHQLVSDWMLDTASKTENVDPMVMHSAQFFMKQYIDLMSPDNFPFLNPSFWRETIDTNGENIKKGMEMLLKDMKSGTITTNDRTKFKIGENIAATKGKVVFQNDLIELIQYSPTTENVFAKPLLFVPPWINKFYVLDLGENLSMVKWAVDQGFTVFIISWINPDIDILL